MQVTGTGFSNGDQALFDGADVTTTFVSSTRLDVSVLGAFLENVGSHTLEVLGQGGSPSNQLSVEVRPSPARHQTWLGGGYTGAGWTSQVILFNPGNQTASVTVTFFAASQLGVQMVSIPPVRVVEVPGPPGVDGFSVRVDSPEVAVAAAVLTRDPSGANQPSFLAGPQDAPAVLWAAPLVQGGDITRIRVTNPGGVTANTTITWRSSAGGSRTEDVTVPPGQEQRADTPLPDTNQWAELTSNTPVLSHFSSGPSTVRAWMGANLQAASTQQVFLAYRENNQELRFRVANPNQATTMVAANRPGVPGDIFNTMLGQRDVYSRTEGGNPFTPSGTLLLLQVTSTLPTAAALALQPSGGPDGDMCALVPLRAANDLILMGGKNRDGWETRYLLFNGGAAPATYTVLIVGVANSLPFSGGTLDPGQGRIIHTADGSFPRPSDSELALRVTSNQPLLGQVQRYDTNASLSCLPALTPP